MRTRASALPVKWCFMLLRSSFASLSLLSISDHNLNPILRSQRHRRINTYRMISINFQTKLLSNRCQAQDDFHGRERRADANSRAATEREVGVLRQALNKIFSPPLRTKFIRLIIKPCVALGGPLKHKYLSSLRHAIAADLAIVNRFAAQAEGRRGPGP